MLYRAFFALPKTITDDHKRPVNALLGSLNMVLQVVSDHEPRAVVFCFGPDAATTGSSSIPPYHADRPPVPDELAWQWAQAPKLFAAFGWSTVTHDSLEADDLLDARRRRGPGGRQRAAPDGRPRPLPVRARRRVGALPAHRA